MNVAKKKVYRLTVIGAGHVLTKYLLPISGKKNGFKIERVISRAKKDAFIDRLYSNPDYPKYRHLDLEKINYQQTGGTPTDIVKKIKAVSVANEVILILTPPQTHFKILKAILKQTRKKVYLEKPAVTDLKDFKVLIQLLKQYKNRVYLAEQYAYGRAPIFLKACKKYRKELGQVNKASLYIEEGKKYFDLTQPWFTSVGPELDIGVHLLAVWFKLLDRDCDYQITKVRQPKNFLKNYGSEAEVIFSFKNNHEVKLFLRCGKREGKNRRYIKLFGEKGNIWQKFISGTAEDSVFIKLKGKTKLIKKSSKNYHYFSTQMSHFLFWLKKPEEQGFVLKALECALKIRQERLRGQDKMARSKKFKLVAMIPARLKSRRVKEKSLREVAGKPLIHHAVKTAIEAGVFEAIYVNSENDQIGMIGQKLGVKYYKRDSKLARDEVKNEEFVYDFVKNIKTDYIFMLNPVAPLITPKEIRRFVKKMLKDKVDTQLSIKEIPTQSFFKNKALNFDVNKPHLSSEEIKPVQVVNWAITGWKTKTFLSNYRKKKSAAYAGKIGLFPISEEAGLNLEQEKDFALAEQIMTMRKKGNKKALKGIVNEYHQKMTKVLAELDLEKIEEITKLLLGVYKKQGRIYMMGNGGSAAIASHFAADLSQNVTRSKQGRVNAISLNDSLSRITAIANDLGYKHIFKEQLYNVLSKDDVVIVISGSGNSANILEALKLAKKIKAKRVALLGFDGGKAARLVNSALLVESFDYTVIENIHMFVCDLITNYFQRLLTFRNGLKS